jgi:hypothetical protein
MKMIRRAMNASLCVGLALFAVSLTGCPGDEPAPPLALGFPSTVNEGDSPECIITLPEALETDLVVNLESSDPNFLAPPTDGSGRATVPAGQRELRVHAQAVQNSYIDAPRQMSLTLSCPGYLSASVSFSLVDDELRGLIVELPETIAEGAEADTGTVRLAGNALARSGYDISIESSLSTALQPQDAVTIEPGANFADFDLFPQQDENTVNEEVEITASHADLAQGSDTIRVIDDD